MKLFMVTDVSTSPCWFLIPAKNYEEALLKCINEKKCPLDKQKQSSCKVEEVKLEGYEIKVVRSS